MTNSEGGSFRDSLFHWRIVRGGGFTTPVLVDLEGFIGEEAANLYPRSSRVRASSGGISWAAASSSKEPANLPNRLKYCALPNGLLRSRADHKKTMVYPTELNSRGCGARCAAGACGGGRWGADRDAARWLRRKGRWEGRCGLRQRCRSHLPLPRLKPASR
jgi:hypothetical protein